jgi:uncharacterized protein (TIGR00255 family)
MQIRSMTGFGQGAAEVAGFRVGVELRTVNNRFADMRSRLPTEVASWEGDIKRRVLSRVKRGRVELTVNVSSVSGGEPRATFNRPLFEEVRASAEALKSEFGTTGELGLSEVLSVPGMFKVESAAFTWGEEHRPVLEQALDEALEALNADRSREGANLQKELLSRVDEMERLTAQIKGLADAFPAVIRDRLIERLGALAGDIELDPARVAQEAVLLADRADITEEIVRLTGHLEQARNLLGRPDGKPLGRRLEFLLQEIHRETNTVSSKTQQIEASQASLALKTECEKFREQIQNLE